MPLFVLVSVPHLDEFRGGKVGMTPKKTVGRMEDTLVSPRDNTKVKKLK